MLCKWKISKLYLADNDLYYYYCLLNSGKTIKTSPGKKQKTKNKSPHQTKTLQEIRAHI